MPHLKYRLSSYGTVPRHVLGVELSQNFINPYKKNADTWDDDEELAQFLKDMTQELDEPIKEWEIQQAISTLKNNKSPGLDGYINEFY